MAELHQEIAQIEDWLREHPHADWVARHDKIVRLRELNEELNIKINENGNTNSTSGKH